jgi:hypothetical protein
MMRPQQHHGVMAGLVPAIHVFSDYGYWRSES